jgi:hypothetical protein
MEINSFGPLRLAPSAASAVSICASQSPAEDAIVIDGSLATDGVATVGAAQLITLVSGGDDSDITFTIAGTDSDGRSQSETVTGANAGTATSTKYFKTVTGITQSGSVATTLTSGNTIASVSNTVRPTMNVSPIAIGIGVILVSGTATYKVQHSYQNGASSHPTLWFDNSAGAKTASSEATYATPVATIRLLLSASSSGVLSANIVQAG